ncbi:SUZ domain-containing protein 1 isoform X1 [Erpetoichthys calabaricus]|uniref:SUZ domain-containing protein 1 isoform X1 n=1 Tax=Erpetoichthys calabaricus TaxID=27687 RepID=UPI002233F5FF|nr:SUZ domain-containing protein 1 isoform X1 [Erpetoichthys calabaricus]
MLTQHGPVCHGSTGENAFPNSPCAVSAAVAPAQQSRTGLALWEGWKMEDEEVAESWEEAADSGEIERRLEEKLRITQKERQLRSPLRTPIVIQDDSLPAAPPPQIRILKRPSHNGSLGTPSPAQRPVAPVKTLAQREAEYAEARRRILGSASPEEESDKPIVADRPIRVGIHTDDIRPPNNVIRQPTGPDGTQGFRQRR